MEVKYNFNKLYRSAKPKLDYRKRAIFQRAALLYRFNEKSDFKSFPDEDRDLLLEKALKRTDGSYRLRKNDRISILLNSIGKDKIADQIEKLDVTSVYTETLRQIAIEPNVQLDQLNNEQLYYCVILAEVFPEKLDKEEVKVLYNRRQFFKPFEQITENFAGRKEETKRINDYIDWLPKEGFSSRIKSFIRNICNWNDKPPMLVQGIGGIGKSTIVSKIIIDNNKENKGSRMPFVYIDFDLPGFSISEPLTILIEAMRQLIFQFPRHKKTFAKISDQIGSNLEMSINKDWDLGLERDSSKQFNSTSTASSRIYVYDMLDEILKQNDLQMELIESMPILVVFDSFEEMQYRATSSELHSFFKFIREISERIPRVRPLFVGRSELDESFDKFKFEVMRISNFDEESAMALLKKTGVENQNIRRTIYDNFGGHPLMLRMATSLAMKEGIEKMDLSSIKKKKWEYLIDRILGHIHDDQVRSIAIPGMLVRVVNTEVIQNVLASPTGLGNISDEKAKYIYEELKKETALITRSVGGGFAFRQDLRITCEEMIHNQYQKESREIHLNAIEYYSMYKEQKDVQLRKTLQAEFFFHHLKLEQRPPELNFDAYEEVRPYLEQSIIELPESSRMYLSGLGHQNVKKNTIRRSTNKDWESYFLGQIKDGLNSELSFLKELYDELRQRKGRVNNGFTEFGLFEALVYQRLNKLQLSRESINHALNNGKKDGNESKTLEQHFLLLKVENFEYEERYKDAMELLEQMRHSIQKTGDALNLKFNFLTQRIESRLSEKLGKVSFEEYANFQYLSEYDFFDSKWQFIFKNLDINKTGFKEHFKINGEFRKLRKRLDSKSLEGYALKQLGSFLKDISYVGEFNIVLRDLILANEICSPKFRSNF